MCVGVRMYVFACVFVVVCVCMYMSGCVYVCWYASNVGVYVHVCMYACVSLSVYSVCLCKCCVGLPSTGRRAERHCA